MLAGPLEVLVGTPMPDRSKVRGQTKSNLPALQVWGFCTGLTALSCKKLLLRKQQRVTYKKRLPVDVLAESFTVFLRYFRYDVLSEAMKSGQRKDINERFVRLFNEMKNTSLGR